MIATKIGPAVEAGTYQFSVTLIGNGREEVLVVSAGELLDFSRFREIVLARTGQLYGDGTYLNWNQELSTLLDLYWKESAWSKSSEKLQSATN